MALFFFPFFPPFLFLFSFFFSRQGPMTLLSATNYAGCRSSSLSNRLCCRGSLEGRSFILLSTAISPRGVRSSVAERVPLRHSFHLPHSQLSVVCLDGFERRGEIAARAGVFFFSLARHNLCPTSACKCACTHAGAAA